MSTAVLLCAASMRRSVCVVPSPLCCFVFRCVSFLCVDLLSLVSAAVWLRRVRCYPARPVAALFDPPYTCFPCFVHSIVSLSPLPASPLYPLIAGCVGRAFAGACYELRSIEVAVDRSNEWRSPAKRRLTTQVGSMSGGSGTPRCCPVCLRFPSDIPVFVVVVLIVCLFVRFVRYEFLLLLLYSQRSCVCRCGKRTKRGGALWASPEDGHLNHHRTALPAPATTRPRVAYDSLTLQSPQKKEVNYIPTRVPTLTNTAFQPNNYTPNHTPA